MKTRTEPRTKVKFYVVVVNHADRRWSDRLFEATISGPLAYEKRKGAEDARRKARQIYGWAKVVKCEVEI